LSISFTLTQVVIYNSGDLGCIKCLDLPRLEKFHFADQIIKNFHPLQNLATMAQKRKQSTSIASSQQPKFAKTTVGPERRLKTAAKSAVAVEEEPSGEEDAFEGFGSDDQEGSGSEDEGSDDSAADSDEDMEVEEDDELDNEDEDDNQEEMDTDETIEGTEETGKVSKTPSTKEVPAHAAQRALAKERKLSRPNGTV
jgi:hypothetical protein